jgi:hypothetical protein
MIEFTDTFNHRVISRHRSPRTAARAERKWLREFARNNTRSSYIPTEMVGMTDAERREYDHEIDKILATSRPIKYLGE